VEKHQSREYHKAAMKKEDGVGQGRGDRGEHFGTWRTLGNISSRVGQYESVLKGGESFWFIARVLKLDCLDVNSIYSLGLTRFHLSESRFPLLPNRSYSYPHHGGNLRMNMKVNHVVQCLAHGRTLHSL